MDEGESVGGPVGDIDGTDVGSAEGGLVGEPVGCFVWRHKAKHMESWDKREMKPTNISSKIALTFFKFDQFNSKHCIPPCHCSTNRMVFAGTTQSAAANTMELDKGAMRGVHGRIFTLRFRDTFRRLCERSALANWEGILVDC